MVKFGISVCRYPEFVLMDIFMPPKHYSSLDMARKGIENRWDDDPHAIADVTKQKAAMIGR